MHCRYLVVNSECHWDIGTSSALGGGSIVLGDNDTGFKQNGDGNLDVYANYVHVMRFVPGSIQSNKTINITGRVNPSER